MAVIDMGPSWRAAGPKNSNGRILIGALVADQQQVVPTGLAILSAGKRSGDRALRVTSKLVRREWAGPRRVWPVAWNEWHWHCSRNTPRCLIRRRPGAQTRWTISSCSSTKSRLCRPMSACTGLCDTRQKTWFMKAARLWVHLGLLPMAAPGDAPNPTANNLVACGLRLTITPGGNRADHPREPWSCRYLQSLHFDQIRPSAWRWRSPSRSLLARRWLPLPLAPVSRRCSVQF